MGQRRPVGAAAPPFLRTSEFLWQEGHTAHATAGRRSAYATRIHHEVYEDFMVNVLAIPWSSA